MIRATPFTAFIDGAITPIAMIGIKGLDPNNLIERVFIVLVFIGIVLAFFFLVVNDDNYEFKLWYGIDDLSYTHVLRGISWSFGSFTVIIIALSIGWIGC